MGCPLCGCNNYSVKQVIDVEALIEAWWKFHEINISEYVQHMQRFFYFNAMFAV